MTHQFLENINTTAEAAQHLSEVREIDIATTPREVVWDDGKVELYRFRGKNPKKVQTPVLIAYALVNRWEMMDLQPKLSFINKLLEEGLDIYLVDWGYAGKLDQCKTMEEYIVGNIGDCVDFIRRQHKIEKVNLLGVCQGGVFSVIYAAVFPGKIKNLVTMVTPIDFDEKNGLLFQWAKQMDADALVDGFSGVVPGDFLNAGFDLLKPMSKARKYLNLPKMIETKEGLMNFLRMEKWVSNSPAQVGEAYRCYVREFYQENKLIQGDFVIGNRPVNLQNITMPVLTIYAKSDHIVPPSSTKPLHDLVGAKDKKLMEFPGGHIGVFVGNRSQKMVAPALMKWLLERDK